MSTPQARLLEAFAQAQRLNQEALQALDQGDWERLERLFEQKSALESAWAEPPREGWTPELLSQVFEAQGEAARSEARLAQALSGLGPRLRNLGLVYGQDLGAKGVQKRLDIDT